MSKEQINHQAVTEVPEFNKIAVPSKLARIAIKDINPGRRVRGSYAGTKKDWDDFKQSLKEEGQIQPITVMEYDTPFEDFRYFLLCGGRRIKALKELEETQVDAKIYPHGLNAYELKAIELSENLHRKDLTVDEKAEAHKDMYDYYISLYGKKESTSPNAPGLSIRDVAKKMKLDKMTLINSLKIAKIFEDVPEAKGKIKTDAEALSLLKRAEKTVRIEKESKEAREKLTNSTEDRAKETIMGSYIVNEGGFLAYAKSLKDESFDLCNFDPDYPNASKDFGGQHTSSVTSITLGHYSTINPENFEGFFKSCLKEIYRILRPNSWLIVWFGYEYFQRILDWAKETKFEVHYNHGKWLKISKAEFVVSHTRNPHRFLGHSIEPFFYFKKGSATIQKPHHDTYMHLPDPPNKRINQYQKPIQLMQEIYDTFLLPAQRIISPCTGSGCDILAAINTGRFAVGCDTSKTQKEAFKHRVLTQPIAQYKSWEQ